jgi:uncharacterized protein (TIGR03085 family)
MATPATIERRALADLLDEIGPDAPTLSGEWTTGDLAAHIAIRDRRPDAAIGILWSRVSGHTERVQASYRDRPWSELVELVRTGPPKWSPTRAAPIDRAVNTIEFFVHHEDVRRAQPDWTVRDLDDALEDDIATALGRSARMLAGEAPAGIVLEPDHGRHRITAKDADPTVVVRGPIGELTLWVYGRQEHARVSYDGDAAAVDAVRSARLGI